MTVINFSRQFIKQVLLREKKNLRHIVELNFRFRNYAWISAMERKSRREKIFSPYKVGHLPKLKTIFYRFQKLSLI